MYDNNRVQTINSQYFKTKLNSATFPIELPYRCIEVFTHTNDLVLDIFSSIGTIAIASKLLNRNFIGFELHKETHSASLNRIDKCTNINGTWFLSKKDKDEYSKLKDEIKIYQYQDDTISFHSNLWYLNRIGSL
jgi:DNA modification methylase